MQQTTDHFCTFSSCRSALMYEDLAVRRLLGPGGKLPVILPIVLYSGAARWNMPRQVSDLVDSVPSELTQYQPHMRYLLLDEGALVAGGTLPEDNLVGTLSRRQHSRSIEEAAQLLHTVPRLMDHPSTGHPHVTHPAS